MYRTDTLPQPPHYLAKVAIGATTPDWAVVLPHMQVGPPVEFGLHVYVPVATTDGILKWAVIDPSSLDSGVVSEVELTLLDHPLEPPPDEPPYTLSAKPIGEALGHVHPACLFIMKVDGESTGLYCDMLAFKANGRLITTPYVFQARQLVIFEPATNTVVWQLQGWGEELAYELYDALMFLGTDRLLVHFARYEFEAFEYPNLPTGSIQNPLDSEDPETIVGFCTGLTGSATGSGATVEAGWAELEALPTFIEALLASDVETATATMCKSARNGYRIYGALSGDKQAEWVVPDREACVKDADGNPVKYRTDFTESYRLESLLLSDGVPGGPWPDLGDLDTVIWQGSARLSFYETTGDPESRHYEYYCENSWSGGSPPWDAFDPYGGSSGGPTVVYEDAKWYALIRTTGNYFEHDVSKRLPWRTYQVSSNGEGIFPAPGLASSDVANWPTDNDFRGRE